MLNRDENIVIIIQNGFNEDRTIQKAVRCGKFGQYATSVESLPKSELYDDFIYK